MQNKLTARYSPESIKIKKNKKIKYIIGTFVEYRFCINLFIVFAIDLLFYINLFAALSTIYLVFRF